MRKSRLRAALAAEFELLQEPPKLFAGQVWGCARWTRGCVDRIVVTPPYDDGPPSERCGTHGLPMDTKIVERRQVGEGARRG